MTGSLTFNHNRPALYLFNGAPRSGKDTVCEHFTKMFCEDLELAELVKFAAPIKRAASAIYCGNNRNQFDKYDTALLKDTVQDIFMGKTCREVQIAISENFLKPYHSKRIFGELAANYIDDAYRDGIRHIFVSDSGFREEAEVMVERYGVGNVFLFRIHREGFTFAGDSRNYITLKDLGVREFDVTNETGNLAAFFKSVETILESCVPKAAA